MTGGVLGCFAAWALLERLDMYKLSRGLFVSFEATWDILAAGLLVAGLLGLLSCFWPACASLRQRVAGNHANRARRPVPRRAAGVGR